MPNINRFNSPDIWERVNERGERGRNTVIQELIPNAPWDDRKGLTFPSNPNDPLIDPQMKGWLREVHPTIRQFTPPPIAAPNYSMGKIKPDDGYAPRSPEEEQEGIRNQEEQQKMAIFELLRKLLQQRRQI
jgi:hypothetical protein|tara:strand:- start:70 stop:462 length:393 start_codon:yes stop_codon:yes gene_type:complete